jgi:hypothetical protein
MFHSSSTSKIWYISRRRRRRTPGLEEPGVNEVSFCTRPHHNVPNTLGVGTRATGPRWRVDSIEGGGIGRVGGNEWGDRMRKKEKILVTRDFSCCNL